LIKRTGVKPQDKVVEKGFRRLEQTLEEVENQQYSPQKDVIPANDVNLGSDKKRFKKIYVEDLDAFAETIKIGDIKLSQDGKGADSSLKIKGSGNSLKIGDLTLKQSGTGDSATLRIDNTSATSDNDVISVKADKIDPGSSDVTLRSTAGTITIENTGGDGESRKDIDLKVPTDRKIEFFVNGTGVGSVDSAGFKNASGDVLGTGGGTNVVSSGTDLPTSVSSHTPNKGDMYIRYSNTTGDGDIDSSIGYNEGGVEIYIRDSDSRLLRIRPSASTTGFLKMSEFIDSAPDYGEPRATQVYYTLTAGVLATGIDTLRIGSQRTVYGYAYYEDVTLPLSSGTPQITFTGEIASTTTRNLDSAEGTYRLYTTTATTIGKDANTGTTDAFVQVQHNANSSTEDDGFGTDVAVTGTPARRIYFKQDRIIGLKRASDSWADALNSSHTSPSGGSSSTAHLCDKDHEYGDFQLSTTHTVTDVGDCYTLTAVAGDTIFFAIPNANIASESPNFYRIGTNDTNQLSGTSNTTATYTNSEGKQDTYKIWYGSPIGANGNVHVKVGRE
jgi:hypothetical protein